MCAYCIPASETSPLSLALLRWFSHDIELKLLVEPFACSFGENYSDIVDDNYQEWKIQGPTRPLPLTYLTLLSGLFPKMPAPSLCSVTLVSFPIGLLLSIPHASPMDFNQSQGRGSSWVVISMMGCEMTTVLFSFLQDSSLVFYIVSSLEDVTEKCKIAQLQHHQFLPIPSARNIRAGTC